MKKKNITGMKVKAAALIMILSVFVFAQKVEVTDEIGQALDYFKKKQYHSAKLILEKHFKAGDRSETVVLPLYKIYYFGEEYENAKQVIESNKKALKDKDRMYDYAEILMNLQEYDKAIDALKGIDRNERYFTIFFTTLQRQGNWEKLQEEFLSNKEKLEKEQNTYWETAILNNLTEKYKAAMKEKKYEEALTIVRELVAVKDSPEHMLHLASIYYILESFGESKQKLLSINEKEMKNKDNIFNYHKLLGMIAFKQNDAEKAIASLKKAETIKGLDFDLNYYFAYAYYKTDQIKLAQKYSLTALKLESTKEINYLTAMIYIKDNNFIEGEKYLDAYLKFESGDNENKNLLKKVRAYIAFDEGNVHYEKKHYRLALDAFLKAIKAYPGDAEPVMKLMAANAYYMRAKPALSRKKADEAALKRANNNLEKAISYAEPASQDNSTFVDAYTTLFNIYTLKKDPETARQMMSRMEKRLEVADDKVLFKLGYSYELQKKYSDALNYYTKAYEQRKEDSYLNKIFTMHKNITIGYINKEKYTEASAEIKKARAYAQEDAELDQLELTIKGFVDKKLLIKIVNTAESAYFKKDYQGALTSYLEAHTMRSDLYGLLPSIAVCYFNIGNYDKAAYYYYEDYTKHMTPKSFTGYLFSLIKLEKFEDVVVESEKAIKKPGLTLNRVLSEINRIHVEALMKIGQQKEAKKELIKLLNKRNNYFFSVLLGNIYFNEKEYLKAESRYKNALLLKNGFVPLYNLGVVNYKKNTYNTSVSYFFKARNVMKDINIDFYLAKNYFNLKTFDQAKKYINICIAADVSDVDYMWWYCRINTFKPSFYAAAAKKKTIFDYIEKCISNKEDREISYLASKLKVRISPDATEEVGFPVTDMSESVPVFIQGLFIYCDNMGKMVCVNEQTGETVWERDEKVPVTGEMLYDSLLYYALENEFIKAIDVNTGKEIYKIKDYTRSYFVDSGYFYYLGKGKICKLEQGTEVFSAEAPFDYKKASIQSADNNVIAISATNAYIYSKEDGRQVTTITLSEEFDRIDTFGKFFYTISVMGKNKKKKKNAQIISKIAVYSTSRGKKLNTITYKGEITDKDFIYVVFDNIILMKSDTGTVSSYNINTGRLVYSKDIKLKIVDATLYENYFYISAEEYTVIKMKGETGKVVWQNKVAPKQDGLLTLMTKD
ncbi:PQQ-binding-like beta-propeller repeat protein [Spirochaetota bacterium]